MLRYAAFAALGLAVAAAPAVAQGTGSTPESKSVALKAPDGSDRGTVKLTQTPHGVLLEARLSGLPDGPHAFHIHEAGICEGDFASAGGHYNPTKHDHGYMAANGPHAGDMPNVTVIGGKAEFSVLNPSVGLTSTAAPLNDVDGSALIVHAGVDDYRTQPTGDAGGRIACGVVFPKAPAKR